MKSAYPPLLVFIGCLFMTPFSHAAEPKADWIDLLPKGLTVWHDTTGWHEVGEAMIKPGSERELVASKPGTGVALVDRKSRDIAYLVSKELHSDVEAVIEFMVPKGSNSGIYFMGRYEVQVLDSFGKVKVGYGDCGGIYQRGGKINDRGHAPAKNASTAPGTWQRFEVTFRAPRFGKDGTKTENARFVKVLHNGHLIHDNVEVTGPTRSALKEFEPEEARGPLRIQGDHGPVAYRTIKLKHVVLP